jgi:CheY-like chemotaxis protein
MIHGFVKQSGGHVRIYSEEDHGTTVKIYLPRLTQAEDVSAVPAAKPIDGQAVLGAVANETVLLVEDNEEVRDYARRVLDELGYRVLEAADAEEASRLLTENPAIDLLFTDVVLPGSVSGRELADEAKAMYPEMPVLFTTGYTRNAIVHQGRLDPDVHLLNKPYTQQDLARKLRELLDAARMEKVPQAQA